MLTPKQLPKHKIYIYISVMSLMVFGTLFLLYQSHEMTVKRTPIIFDIPAESVSKNQVVDKKEVVKEQIDVVVYKDTDNQSVETVKVDGFDILSSSKYRALQEQITVNNQNQTTGRRNPFEP